MDFEILFVFHLDEAECELNCKPIDMNYFAPLKDRVADGTSCFSPIDFVKQNRSGRAMCVEGVCKVRFYAFTNIKCYHLDQRLQNNRFSQNYCLFSRFFSIPDHQGVN